MNPLRRLPSLRTPPHPDAINPDWVLFWEDDYCQIELVPVENRAFLYEQLKEIEAFARMHDTESGFDAVFERTPLPIDVDCKEFRKDYFTSLLTSAGFSRTAIRNPEGFVFHNKENGMSAYGDHSFAVFFESDEELISRIWLTANKADERFNKKKIASLFEQIGLEMQLLLADWNCLQIVDLVDKRKVRTYLNDLV